MARFNDLKHISAVRVIVLQDAKTQSIDGKIVAQFSDAGVCTAAVFIYDGPLRDKWLSVYRPGEVVTAKAGGCNYDKLASCICQIMKPLFPHYSEVADLDSGSISKWFASHGYIASIVL